MGRPNGAKDYEKQETDQWILDRAKAECQFSDHLYQIILAYQNRDNVRPARRKPLKESERVGELSLELSRLYNRIWSVALDLNSNARPKKKQQEVIA